MRDLVSGGQDVFLGEGAPRKSPRGWAASNCTEAEGTAGKDTGVDIHGLCRLLRDHDSMVPRPGH